MPRKSHNQLCEIMAHNASCVPNLPELLGMPIEDGMVISWRGRKVWIPVSESTLLETLRSSKDNLDKEYHEAYIAQDFSLASKIYMQIQRKFWKKIPHKVRTSRLHNAIGTHTESEWENILQKYKLKCANCKKKTALEKDHIVPLVAGGSNLAVNLQPLCKSCNSAKSGRILQGTQLGIFDQISVHRNPDKTPRARS